MTSQFTVYARPPGASSHLPPVSPSRGDGPRKTRFEAVARLARVLASPAAQSPRTARPMSPSNIKHDSSLYSPPPRVDYSTLPIVSRTSLETIRRMPDGLMHVTRNGVVKIFAPDMTARDRDIIFSMRPRRTRDDVMLDREIGFTTDTQVTLGWSE